MRVGLGAIGGVGLLLASLAQAQELREVRVWDSAEGTRVVLDLDTATTHELQTLSNPDRLVIDLRDTHAAKGLVSETASTGLVQGVRTGDRGDALRVVLDLKHFAAAKIDTIEPSAGFGYRLVIDFAGDAVAAAQPPPIAPPPQAAVAPTVAPAASTVSRAKTTVYPNRQRPIVIAVDAGHGGEDPGAQGLHGTQEKDITLAIARKLAARINQEPGFSAVLIRDGDYFIPLRGRINKAREVQADLFVSVHCNASTNRGAQGSSVYVLSPKGATNEHSRWLADKENAADLMGGIELQDKDDTLAAVLFDISQTSAMEASIDVGGRVLAGLSKINSLIRSDVQQAGFVVLKSPDIPSILVETAFISNPQEEKQLRDGDYQAQMAGSILAGVKGYFESYRPSSQVVADNSDTIDADEDHLVKVGLRKSKRARRASN